jgi:hypothetical protein
MPRRSTYEALLPLLPLVVVHQLLRRPSLLPSSSS